MLGYQRLPTAQLLAAAVRNQPADLILCGSLGEGGAHGIVGRELARQLDRPYVGAVIEMEIDARSEPRAATVMQRLERGDRWSWSVDLPLVCGVERALFSPRYLAVKRAQRAASKSPVLCDVTGGKEAAVEAATAKGAFAVVERVPPRVRPRKPTVMTKTLSAADRMKLMRGGGMAGWDMMGMEGGAGMKAIVYDRYGSPDVLRLDDIATPTPGRGQVLVRVNAAASPEFAADLTALAATPYRRIMVAKADAAPVEEHVAVKMGLAVEYVPGEWTHVALVHGDGVLRAYKNGLLVGSISSGTTTPAPSPTCSARHRCSAGRCTARSAGVLNRPGATSTPTSGPPSAAAIRTPGTCSRTSMSRTTAGSSANKRGSGSIASPQGPSRTSDCCVFITASRCLVQTTASSCGSPSWARCCALAR